MFAFRRMQTTRCRYGDHCLRSRHYVNVVVAGKHPAPQRLAMDVAAKHCTEGIHIWQWASNGQGVAPNVAMACCGDVPTLETLAAVSSMREHLPNLGIRLANVVDFRKPQPQTEHPHGLSDMDFDEFFTRDKPIIFAFHACPWLIHRLTYVGFGYQGAYLKQMMQDKPSSTSNIRTDAAKTCRKSGTSPSFVQPEAKV